MDSNKTKYLFAMDGLTTNRDDPPALIQVEDESIGSSDIQRTYSEEFQCSVVTPKCEEIEADSSINRTIKCDACPHCEDTCLDVSCISCKEKKERRKDSLSISNSHNMFSLFGFGPNFPSVEQNSYTMCQIRRHASKSSAWLLVGNDIYDVTTYIDLHPGGERSILKRCGGLKDCRQDMYFHSEKARKLWRKYYIGKLKPCGFKNSYS